MQNKELLVSIFYNIYDTNIDDIFGIERIFEKKMYEKSN